MLAVVEDRESVNYVRAELGIDVLGQITTDALAVPGPVGEVANDL